MNKVIFVDFDGTITKTDTCDAMTRAFASQGWEEIGRLWEQKQLTTIECANKLFKLMNADLDQMGQLMDTIEIDAYFKDFVAMCREAGYKLYILSDGYDYNINRILKKHGIELPFYSNRLLYEDGFQIECPYHNHDCGKCGTCKTSLISKLMEAGDQTVYIGDGYSDTCASSNADVVFAKGHLFRYCAENEIPVIRFDTFKDIIDSKLI